MSILINKKLYGEPNPDTETTSDNELLIGKFIISDPGKKIKSFNPGPKRLLVTNDETQFGSFYFGEPDKLVGVENGVLTLYPDIPFTPPLGRVKITDSEGSQSAIKGFTPIVNVTLEPGWYEVEVKGAGGGGGGGIEVDALPEIHGKGGNGGNGGYYKTTFYILTPTNASLQPGHAGGPGFSRVYENVWGTLVRSNGGNLGIYGVGGRSVYTFGSKGNNGQYTASLITGQKDGGVGINGGANGGDILTPSSGMGVHAGGTGGGANGPFGGKGGSCVLWDGYSTTFGSPALGGAGGAGGGNGNAGVGGRNGEFMTNPDGFGGGGGGDGYVYGLDLVSAGGGGGGGASRFVCGDLEIIAGGGGGGAGAARGFVPSGVIANKGNDGKNNMNANAGGGSAGGVGPNGKLFINPINGSILIPPGSSVDLSGKAGQPGKVTLWRCV